MENDTKKSYEFSLRILGNEVFALGLSTTDSSNRWMAIGLLTAFSLLTLMGAYGEKFVSLYNSIVN